MPLQIAAIVCALPAIALAPPAQGRMLLIPVLPGSSDHLAADAVAHGARLVAAGPISGSLVVEGEFDKVSPGLLSHGVLTVAATFVDCSDPAELDR